MFLSLDGTSIVQLINFVIFFAILSVVFLRPVGAAIMKRRAYIESVTNDAIRYQLEVRSLRAEADAKRAAERRAADERLAKMRSSAEAEAAEITARFSDRANAIANEAREEVEAELRAARAREPELADILARGLLDRAVGAGR